MDSNESLEVPRKASWWLPVGAVIVLFALIGGLAWWQGQGSPKVVTKVGAVIPLTGASSLWGGGVKDGMDLAHSEINTDNKERFKVIYEDSQSKNDVAVTAGQKLINVDMINALYTHYNGPSVALSPIAQAKGLPFFYDTYSTAILEDNPLSFKGYLDYGDACERYAKYAKENGAKKIAILNEFGDSYVYCKQGLAKYYSDREIEVTETLANADFRTLLLKLKQGGVDAFVLNTNEPHAINLFDQLKELNLKFDSIFCEESTCYTSAVQAKSGFVENLINYDPYFTDNFLKKLTDKFGTNDIVRITPIAYGYYDTMRLYEASKECKNLDKSCYITAISNVNNLGVFKDAPTKDRGYYPALKFKKVGADGAESEIKL
ncbi:MAG: ABC transporter substrate-binding protein [Candidatus Berkelbacteria bacterium]|nr:ABC transporter substrate-binding protein [Candidatus Berkelbacteria bacterium]